MTLRELEAKLLAYSEALGGSDHSYQLGVLLSLVSAEPAALAAVLRSIELSLPFAPAVAAAVQR